MMMVATIPYRISRHRVVLYCLMSDTRHSHGTMPDKEPLENCQFCQSVGNYLCKWSQGEPSLPISVVMLRRANIGNLNALSTLPVAMYKTLARIYRQERERSSYHDYEVVSKLQMENSRHRHDFGPRYGYQPNVCTEFRVPIRCCIHVDFHCRPAS